MCSPYRPKNSGKFWIRKRVPRELKPVVGQTEIKRSLGTTDPKEARRLAPIVCAEIDQIISDARRSHYMDSTDVSRLTGEHFRDRLSKIKTDAIDQEWDWETFQLEQNRLIDSLQKNLPRDLSKTEYEHEADKRKAAAGQELMTPTLKKHRLTPPDRLLHLIGIEGYTVELEAYRAAASRLFGNRHWQPPEYARKSEIPDQATLPELFADYVKSDPTLAPRTISDWRTIINRAHSFFGNKPAAEITRQDVQTFVDALLTGNRKANPKGKALAGKTIKDGYLAALSRVYKFAIERERLKENPASYISVKKEKSPIRGYNREEVRILLEASRKTPSKRTKQETANIRRWVPWLAAFTGARISEILWLERNDVKFEGNVAYIDIHPDLEHETARRVKNSSSIRVVPLHPAIIEEGFLDYWRSLPAQEKYLFPGEWSDQYGDRTRTPATKLGEWIKRQLPKDTEWKRHSPSHSLRHWMIQECRIASIDGDYARVLAGHGSRDEHSKYGRGDVPLLHQLLKRIPSPEEWQ